jgi:hypothetical protein
VIIQPLDFKYFFKEFIEKFFVPRTEMKRVTLILPVFFFVCENCERTIAVRGHRSGGDEALQKSQRSVRITDPKSIIRIFYLKLR